MNPFLAIFLIWIMGILSYGAGRQVGKKQREIEIVRLLQIMIRREGNKVMKGRLLGEIDEVGIHQANGYLDCVKEILSLLGKKHEGN